MGDYSLVAHYYSSILGRDADTGGKAFWEGEAVRLSRLGVNINEAWFALAMNFFNSAEYGAFNRPDAAFVADLYRTFFNREPDAGGQSYWSSQLGAGLPREVLLAAFMLSPEFLAFTRSIFGKIRSGPEVDMVVDFYRGLLGRAPDSGGFNSWVTRFRAAQCAGEAAVRSEVDAISSAFVDSGEYGARNRNNSQAVGDLYNAFLRRGGDLDGVKFWITQLDSGVARQAVRRKFLESAEFSARVNAVIAAGCQHLAPGSFRYFGPPPQQGPVQYVTRSGAQLVAPNAYIGWVSLLVDVSRVTPQAAAAAIVQSGGEIVAAIPLAGTYEVRVSAGSERAFLSKIYANAWVREGGATIQATPGLRNYVYDANGGAKPADLCLYDHGSIVQAIANRRGGGFALNDLEAGVMGANDLADNLWRDMKNAEVSGDVGIYNISWNYDPGPLDKAVRPECDLACVRQDAAQQEYFLLAEIFSTVQQLWETWPSAADHGLVTIVVGNPQVSMDPYIDRLRTEFPAAFARIVLVGGADAAGAVKNPSGVPYGNYSDDADIVFARSEGVQATVANVGAVTCSGTSYAAPEVASVLDQLWKANPNATSERIRRALRLAMAGNRVLPQETNGWTKEEFIERGRLTSRDFKLTLFVTGNGTATPSPLGPVHPGGTQVIVLQVPGQGSVFKGWSGACTGTSGCVVTMDADKSVSAAFDIATTDCTATLSNTSLNYSPAGGPVTVTVTIAAGCTWAPSVANAPWLTLAGSGNGSGTFTATAAPNTGAPRTATIRVANINILVNQGSGTVYACSTRYCYDQVDPDNVRRCYCSGSLNTTCNEPPVADGGSTYAGDYCRPGVVNIPGLFNGTCTPNWSCNGPIVER